MEDGLLICTALRMCIELKSRWNSHTGVFCVMTSRSVLGGCQRLVRENESVRFSETLVITLPDYTVSQLRISQNKSPSTQKSQISWRQNSARKLLVEFSTVFILILIYSHKLLRVYIYKMLLDNQINFYVIISKGSGGILWTRQRNFGLHKILGNFWAAERLTAFQEGLSSKELVSYPSQRTK